MKVNDNDKSNIILSIGMIVKNEEKVLERSLRSLQPIMDAISCELIIADTGSTDSSLEIAKKYTDKVFNYEWNNDFSAARNFTLEKAQGQWFLYIDADEYFDKDINEITRFFLTPELCSKFRTCQITCRSYHNKEKTDYHESTLGRFHRIKDVKELVCFEGKIHETIYNYAPIFVLKTILHHTGYCFESEQEMNKKLERNLNYLYDEYAKDPKDLRTLIFMIDTLVKKPKERKKYVDEALNIARDERKNPRSNVTFLEAIKYYKSIDKIKAKQLCEEYLDSFEEHDKFIATLSVYYWLLCIYIEDEQYKNALDVYGKYEMLYEDFQNNNLNITDMMYHSLAGVIKPEHDRAMLYGAYSFIKNKKYSDAISITERLDITDLYDENFINYYALLKDLVEETNFYEGLANCYQKVDLLNDDERKSQSIRCIESIYYDIQDSEKQIEFAKSFVSTGVEDELSKLMMVIASQKTKEFNELFFEYINNSEMLDDKSEVIYIGIKNKCNLSVIIEKIHSSKIRSVLYNISDKHDDFSKCVYEFGVPDCYLTSIKELYWITSLYEVASCKCDNIEGEIRYEIYLRFLSLLGDYVFNLYDSDFLADEENVALLPNLHRFGYYMCRANQKLNEGKATEYVREMRKALVNCESMKEMVEFLLEQFKIKMGL